jgi:hypothetical protein
MLLALLMSSEGLLGGFILHLMRLVDSAYTLLLEILTLKTHGHTVAIADHHDSCLYFLAGIPMAAPME